MKPKTTLWPLDDHSKGKHEVLRYYLEAWFPILGSFAPRVVIIDGFAGPGRYAGGEPGSPLIALDAFKRHVEKTPTWKGEGVFLFIEEKQDRADHLASEIEALQLPATCRCKVVRSEFTAAMTETLDKLPAGKQLAPAFVMLDPFGVAGAPMSLVKRVLQSGKAEFYISFMYEYIDRFKTKREFDGHLTDLYGSDAWKAGVDLPDGDSKRKFFFGLYEEQLRKAGATQVVRFDVFRKGHLVYALFFATKHWKGADVMKQAIWKAAPSGDFQFEAGRTGQMKLFDFDASQRPKVLQDHFRGKGWVTIEAIEEFIGSDQTDYTTTQLKTMTLVPMEKTGAIEVDPASRKKRSTYPPGTRIRFP